MFDLANIRRLPISTISELYLFCVKTIKAQQNSEAVPVANLGVLIYKLGVAALGVEKPREVSVFDFMPYPELDEKPKTLSKATRETLKRLIAEGGLIGRRVVPLVGSNL